MAYGIFVCAARATGASKTLIPFGRCTGCLEFQIIVDADLGLCATPSHGWFLEKHVSGICPLVTGARFYRELVVLKVTSKGKVQLDGHYLDQRSYEASDEVAEAW